jgi:excinuclease ABC subunit A
VKIRLGLFVCVTGVSGSGKSTLIDDILYRALAHHLHGSRLRAGAHDRIDGLAHIDKVINIDQSPIGRTPRSNPATYTKTFDLVRELFAQTPDARARGFAQGRFSFNVRGGRCEACEGDGIVRIEMHFLPDVYVPCDVCKGKRYNRETLEVKYKGKSIADVLDMSVDEALQFFEAIPRIRRKLRTLADVGLGYVRLGQPATTLSGGEAQRVKLSTELSRRDTGRTVYILDEPTVGLHFADVERLLEVLHRLVDVGNTVIVIEHNLDVIKTADWIVDLGPEGGELGGEIVAEGTPEDVGRSPASYTGQYLRLALRRSGAPGAARSGARDVPVADARPSGLVAAGTGPSPAPESPAARPRRGNGFQGRGPAGRRGGAR